MNSSKIAESEEKVNVPPMIIVPFIRTQWFFKQLINFMGKWKWTTKQKTISISILFTTRNNNVRKVKFLELKKWRA